MTLIQHFVLEYASQLPKTPPTINIEYIAARTYDCSKLLKSPKNTVIKST